MTARCAALAALAALAVTLAAAGRAVAQPADAPLEVRFVSPLVKVRGADDPATAGRADRLLDLRGLADSFRRYATDHRRLERRRRAVGDLLSALSARAGG